jgi:hypothetical protein
MRTRTIVAGLAIAALATTVATADAMPVRQIETERHGGNVEVSAIGLSPPSGACGAYYVLRIYRDDVVLRHRFGRFNACRVYAEDDSGWSGGYFQTTFRNVPPGPYIVCAGAGNTRYAGGIHVICRRRSL